MSSPSTGPTRTPGVPIRVCHVIHSLQRGGAEDSLATIASASSEVDVQVEVVSILEPGDSRVARELLDEGVPVTSLGLTSRWDPRALPAAVKLVRDRRPDVIHAHLKHADLVGAYASRRTGIPMVSTLHVVEDRPSAVGRFKRSAGTWARRRRAALTIAVSDAQRAWYLDALGADPTRVVTIRNGVPAPVEFDAAAREAVRAELGVRPDELMALNVALMRRGKGHEDVLDVAEALGPDGGVRFVLAGDGELRGDLERRAAERAARSGPVVFAGFRDDVPALVASSDVIVHPSHADALPTALLHGLAAGRPIVAYAVGGVPEIVREESGILVALSDRRAMTDAVRRLCDSPELRVELGTGARDLYEREYTVQAWMGRLRDAYASVIQKAGAAT